MTVTYDPPDATSSPTTFAIAVEIIVTISHEKIIATIPWRSPADDLARFRMPFHDRQSIKAEGQEPIMMPSHRTISVLDPYTSGQMCRVPVRGNTCKHLECFDLEIHLSMHKREHSDYLSTVDGWHCPICMGDARPNVLFKDEFMMQVYRDLFLQGLSNIKAIVVEADGSWKPSQEGHKS